MIGSIKHRPKPTQNSPKITAFFILLTSIFSLCFASPVMADDTASSSGKENQCEVMKIDGSGYLIKSGTRSALKEKMVLQAGDTLEVDKGSSVDLAYDREWKNVSRISENSRVKINEINPTKLVMIEGDIYAKLHALPKGSSFEVKTPTAVGAVRGSEYQTVYRNGVTNVYNFSNSQVEVSGLGANHQPRTDLTVRLKNFYKTSVLDKGLAPKEPELSLPGELDNGRRFSADIDRHVEAVRAEGRQSQIQENLGDASSSADTGETATNSEGTTADDGATEETSPNVDYSIVSSQSSGTSNVSFYDFTSEKGDLLLNGASIKGNDSMICMDENSEITVANDANPQAPKKIIKGPVNGLLEDLFQRVDETGRVKNDKNQKPTTTIAVQRGSVQATTLLKDKKGKEIMGSTVLIQGNSKGRGDASPGKPGANYARINPCNYVTPIFVPNLDLDKVTLAELIERYKKGINLEEEFLPADLY